MKKTYKEKIKIPLIRRDGNLISRLLAVTIVGFDHVMDEKSRLYLRLLTRLIDKSFTEYEMARECLIEEVRTNDKLALRFTIINHLENCIGALSRASKLVNLILNGLIIQRKGKVKTIRKENLDIVKLFDPSLLKKLNSKNASNVRNRVEHIDKDIYNDLFKNGLFLDVDSNYEAISINNKFISLDELAQIIGDYHNLILGIFRRLPNRMENRKYYYDKRKK